MQENDKEYSQPHLDVLSIKWKGGRFVLRSWHLCATHRCSCLFPVAHIQQDTLWKEGRGFEFRFPATAINGYLW
jgi:hypothetical protein